MLSTVVALLPVDHAFEHVLEVVVLYHKPRSSLGPDCCFGKEEVTL